MSAFTEVPDLPDTWLYAPAVTASGHRPGPGRCGCNPSYGQSCDGCDGTDHDRYQASRDRAADIRDQWRTRLLTPHEYYLLSAAADFDGLPSRDAVAALQRHQSYIELKETA